ncbi:MAG: DUF2934 domain-containing protein [Steroidobacteraceae bacterium]
MDLRDRIEARAYEIWEKAGRPHGEHEAHWLEAERQIEDEGWHRDPRDSAMQRLQVQAVESEMHLDRPVATPRRPASLG